MNIKTPKIMNKNKPLCAALLLFIGTSSNAELLFTSETGFIVENTFETEASKNKAWRALVDDVGKWWPSDHTWWGDASKLSINEFAGGCFCEKSGNNSAEHMRISYVDQYTVMRMTGGLGPLQGMGMYGALEWTFTTAKTGKTKVSMKYSVNGINPDGFEQLAPIVDKVQAMQLNGLRIHLQASH